MSWVKVLLEEDFRLYRENISLLEEQVIERFAHAHEAPDVLRGIRSVPRHLFVHGEYRYLAYTDNAFPTDCGLTTSAPSVIATMIFHSGIRRGGRLLYLYGDRNVQRLYILERKNDRFKTTALEGVSFSFLPLIG
jgi:protein-L-isoaspartate O-methyltransferase